MMIASSLSLLRETLQLDGEETDVVGESFGGREGFGIGNKESEQLLGGTAQIFVQRLLETLRLVKLARRALLFREAIGLKQQQIDRRELHLARDVAGIWKDAQRRAPARLGGQLL